MALDVLVALAVWRLGLWRSVAPWPDAVEDDAGAYPVLGSVKVVLWCSAARP